MDFQSPSLLITDDDRDLRETLGRVFDRRGFRTLLAADGQEALEIIRSEIVHLLVVDMHMPRLTGLDTIRQLNRLATPPPSILISAALDEALAKQARQAAAYCVLAKPVSFEAITGVVGEAMAERYGWDLPDGNLS